jgi:hypothetical protein
MARVRVRQRVPVFSKAALDLADLCAREIWRGKSYSTSSYQQSEEELLLRFSLPFLSEALGIEGSERQPIGVDLINQFIVTAGLKQMNITKNNRDTDAGIKTLNKLITRELKKALKDVFGTHFHILTTELTTELSKAFHKMSGTSTTSAYFPLASRVLFFAAPNLPVFMYSDKLGEALKIEKEDKALSIEQFNEAMSEGLNDNWFFLKDYQMPFLSNKIENDEFWLQARDNGWWQRRVLDLACVINMTHVKPKDFLIDLTSYQPRQHP